MVVAIFELANSVDQQHGIRRNFTATWELVHLWCSSDAASGTPGNAAACCVLRAACCLLLAACRLPLAACCVLPAA
jgi:hypothetical protein